MVGMKLSENPEQEWQDILAGMAEAMKRKPLAIIHDPQEVEDARARERDLRGQ